MIKYNMISCLNVIICSKKSPTPSFPNMHFDDNGNGDIKFIDIKFDDTNLSNFKKQKEFLNTINYITFEKCNISKELLNFLNTLKNIKKVIFTNCKLTVEITDHLMNIAKYDKEIIEISVNSSFISNSGHIEENIDSTKLDTMNNIKNSCNTINFKNLNFGLSSQLNKISAHKDVLKYPTIITFQECRINADILNIILTLPREGGKLKKLIFNNCSFTDGLVVQLHGIRNIDIQIIPDPLSKDLENIMQSMFNMQGQQQNNQRDEYGPFIQLIENEAIKSSFENILKQWKHKKNSPGGEAGKLEQKLDIAKKIIKFNIKPYSKLFENDEENAKHTENMMKILDMSIEGNKELKDKIITRIKTGIRAGQFEKPLLLVGEPGIGKTEIIMGVGAVLCYLDGCYNKTNITLEGAVEMAPDYFGKISFSTIEKKEDLKGHLETYQGSREGLLVGAMVRKEFYMSKIGKNPLILPMRGFTVICLDELDKTNTRSGTTSADALIDLDTTRNAYLDMFLQVGLDLTQVEFIATANDISKIPSYIKDRFEIFFLSGYSASEKFNIVKNKVIKRVMKKMSLPLTAITIDDEAISEIVGLFGSKTVGVRSIEEAVSSIIIEANKVYEKQKKSLVINKSNLYTFIDSNLMFKATYGHGIVPQHVDIKGRFTAYCRNGEGVYDKCNISATALDGAFKSGGHLLINLLGGPSRDEQLYNTSVQVEFSDTLVSAFSNVTNPKFNSLKSMLQMKRYTVGVNMKYNWQESPLIYLCSAICVLSCIISKLPDPTIQLMAGMDNQGILTELPGDALTRLKFILNSADKKVKFVILPESLKYLEPQINRVINESGKNYVKILFVSNLDSILNILFAD